MAEHVKATLWMLHRSLKYCYLFYFKNRNVALRKLLWQQCAGKCVCYWLVYKLNLDVKCCGKMYRDFRQPCRLERYKDWYVFIFFSSSESLRTWTCPEKIPCSVDHLECSALYSTTEVDLSSFNDTSSATDTASFSYCNDGTWHRDLSCFCQAFLL